MKKNKILIIAALLFTSSCFKIRYENIYQLNAVYNDITYYNNNQIFEITFACDQWFYTPKLYKGDTLNEKDCEKHINKKIKIIGEDSNSFIGFISNDLLAFSPREFVNNRVSSDKIVYQICKNVLYTYTSIDNYKISKQFLTSTYKPNEFTDFCFEIHSNLHFMKKEFQINDNEFVFNIRSSLVYLTFHNKFESEKKQRFVLKVLGWKDYLSTDGKRKFPHYLALQIE